MNYEAKAMYLVVVIDPKDGGLATQIVNQPFIQALGIFNWYMRKFFVLGGEKLKAADGGKEPDIAPEIVRYLALVNNEIHDEAYGVFLRGAKQTDLRICGVYRWKGGQFKKMTISVLKGVADGK